MGAGLAVPPPKEKIRKKGYQLTITGTAGDGKAFLIPVFNIVDCCPIDPGFGAFGNQEIDAFDMHRLLIGFWLIQSQPDTGPVSAHTLQIEANILTLVAAEGLLNLSFSFIGNGEHFCTSLIKLPVKNQYIIPPRIRNVIIVARKVNTG